MKDKILVVIKLVVFVLSLALIIIGQKTVGKPELGLMLLGLSGLLGLLYDYNRKYA
ncbi:hypothetical protein RCG24_18740 [Neobacillus sp. OS1-32]|jgi:hypothetical protein|uniref:Group-specific protein n=1 Tax=Neobacillus paridis TaxID=2803862 RepID=A0ABS1TUE1_9BACI|nr:MULTISPECIES: hypothetical protein [Neobacillus]MBL4954664.1 hypothetical protein [Neobacillus paridis]WML29921.1 hypothetical protein RCG24_18740 [Neobacillus sp. OS1-32]